MSKWPRLFLIAAQFLTRWPMPRNLETDEKELGQAAMFFPVVGAIVGASGALLHAALLKVLPPSTCALLTLVYLSFITNAFHEDGLADAFDGFGGGWTRERALEIMRDSRVGTFG
ncbi:MAG TPA: adenosylcobinamide-GDP ribazoletransferase, partial [Blastocatellia bacterium]|nr:adenosylcobinamide-GDP ribazoletransferase [Blastocatellia bacterium]